MFSEDAKAITPQELVGQVTIDGQPVQALPGKKNNRWVMTPELREESENFLRSITQYFSKDFFTTGNFGLSARAFKPSGRGCAKR